MNTVTTTIIETDNGKKLSAPEGSVRCQQCKGNGGCWFTPFRVSPPSLIRGDGGYEGHSNIKRKGYTHCEQCGGKGFHTPDDIKRFYDSFRN